MADLQLIQGVAWWNGEDVYRVLPTLRIYFIVRGMMGVLMLVGGCLFVWNVLFTVLGRGGAALAREGAPASSAPGKEVAA